MEFNARDFLAGLFVEAGEPDPVPSIEPAERMSVAPTCPSELPADWACEWLERSSIREYDAGQDREGADRDALAEVLIRMKNAGLFP